MALFGKSFPTAGALLLAATTLGAQAAPACDVAASKGALAKASFAVEQARGAQGTPAAPTLLSAAVKQLEAAKGEDPTVQALYLGQTLSFWLGQPNMPLTPRRGTLGFVQNPETPIDLVVTIDSLFRVVETAKPACTDITTAYRGGLPGYLGLVNGAISALNAEKLDSAELLASSANRLYPGSPYGVMVLGSIASKRKNDAKALEYWSTAATVAAKDTIYRDVERQVLNNQGMAYMSTATTASGAQRAEAARHAIQTYNTLLAVPGTTGVYATSGRQNLQSAQLLLGDTAAFVAGYQPMLANPSGYSYQDLLNTAVNAVRANRTADAAKLFEGTLAVNPWNRDALYNLGVEYIALNQNDKVQPLVQRLIAIDPANPVNYYMAAQAFMARAKEAQAAKRGPLIAAYNDSTLQWISRGDKLPTEVTFNTFYSTDKVTTVAGTITDRRDKAATPTAAPATRGAKAKATATATPSLPAQPVTVTIEVLDKSGAVVGSKVITTAPLAAGAKETFNTTIPGDAIAYRYRVGA